MLSSEGRVRRGVPNLKHIEESGNFPVGQAVGSRTLQIVDGSGPPLRTKNAADFADVGQAVRSEADTWFQGCRTGAGAGVSRASWPSSPPRGQQIRYRKAAIVSWSRC